MPGPPVTSLGAAVAALALAAAPVPAVVKGDSHDGNLAAFPLLALPQAHDGPVLDGHVSHSSHSSHTSHLSGAHSSHGSHLSHVSHSSHFSANPVGPAPTSSSPVVQQKATPPPKPHTVKPAKSQPAGRPTTTPAGTSRSASPTPLKARQSSAVATSSAPRPTDITISPASHNDSDGNPVVTLVVLLVLAGGVATPIYVHRRRRKGRR